MIYSINRILKFVKANTYNYFKHILPAILLPIFLLNIKFVSGQYWGSNQINESEISKWSPKLAIEYYGSYEFGEGESESTLTIYNNGIEIIAQIEFGTWNSDATDWIIKYEELTNVSIDNTGKLYSDQYKGEFVFWGGEKYERKKCLKIYDSWTGTTEKKGEYELGVQSSPIYKYVIASTRKLNHEELRKMSIAELQIMRNEIFARYGYKFKQGGEMDSYFRSMPWYIPRHSDVNQFLTEIEKTNIKMIQIEEKR